MPSREGGIVGEMWMVVGTYYNTVRAAEIGTRFGFDDATRVSR